jgi:hypothetical protein
MEIKALSGKEEGIVSPFGESDKKTWIFDVSDASARSVEETMGSIDGYCFARHQYGGIDRP